MSKSLIRQHIRQKMREDTNRDKEKQTHFGEAHPLSQKLKASPQKCKYSLKSPVFTRGTKKRGTTLLPSSRGTEQRRSASVNLYRITAGDESPREAPKRHQQQSIPKPSQFAGTKRHREKLVPMASSSDFASGRGNPLVDLSFQSASRHEIAVDFMDLSSDDSSVQNEMREWDNILSGSESCSSLDSSINATVGSIQIAPPCKSHSAGACSSENMIDLPMHSLKIHSQLSQSFEQVLSNSVQKHLHVKTSKFTSPTQEEKQSSNPRRKEYSRGKARTSLTNVWRDQTYKPKPAPTDTDDERSLMRVRSSRQQTSDDYQAPQEGKFEQWSEATEHIVNSLDKHADLAVLDALTTNKENQAPTENIPQLAKRRRVMSITPLQDRILSDIESSNPRSRHCPSPTTHRSVTLNHTSFLRGHGGE